MPRLLLLATTTTYKAQAFLDAAARIGVEVTVGTDRPQVLAALHPAGNLTLDFSDPSWAVHEIAAFARRYPIAAVLAADDEGTEIAAAAARALGLPGNDRDAVVKARHKDQLRAALQAANLPVPWFRSISLAIAPEEVADQIDYPCVLKPLSSSASRGVIRADDPSQFVAAFERLRTILDGSAVETAPPEILVEGYIPGLEVALEGVLEDGSLRVLALFDKPDPLDGPFFEETIYVTPSRHAPAMQEALAAMAQRACTAIGLQQGPLHAELRWNDSGAWLLEAAPRSIGGLCARTLRFGDGSVTLEELLLRQALQQDIHGLERETRAAGVMMVPIPRAGMLREVRGTAAAVAVPGIEDVRVAIPPGQEVAPPPEGGRYLGFLFARGATPEAVEEALRTAHARLEIDIEPLQRSWAGGGSHVGVL